MKSTITISPLFVGRLKDPVLIGQVKSMRKELLRANTPSEPPVNGFERIRQIFNRLWRQFKIWLTKLIVPATPSERLGNLFRRLRYF